MTGTQPRTKTIWIGRILSGLAVAFLLFDGAIKFFMDRLPPEALEAGAIASHVRVSNPLFSHTLFPIYVAIFIWLGLYLRDSRVRDLLSKQR